MRVKRLWDGSRCMLFRADLKRTLICFSTTTAKQLAKMHSKVRKACMQTVDAGCAESFVVEILWQDWSIDQLLAGARCLFSQDSCVVGCQPATGLTSFLQFETHVGCVCGTSSRSYFLQHPDGEPCLHLSLGPMLFHLVEAFDRRADQGIACLKICSDASHWHLMASTVWFCRPMLCMHRSRKPLVPAPPAPQKALTQIAPTPMPPSLVSSAAARAALPLPPFMNGSVAYAHGRRPSHRDAGGVRPWQPHLYGEVLDRLD